MNENDVCFLTGEQGKEKRGDWPVCRVLQAHADDDGIVRKVTVLMKNGTQKVRPVNKLALLEAAE